MAHRSCKQYDECIALAETAAELGPNSFLVHRTLAECYALSGRIVEAKASADKALSIAPKYTVKDLSKVFANTEKAQEIATRIVKARLMAGFPPDESLKNIEK
jgi:tetratricopeptide (TPR) repeat protein